MEKNTFIKKLLFLSIPIIIQQFIQAALNLVDTVMIGRLGSDEIAAVGIANQVFFFVMMIIFGLNSGISVYIAQFWGRKDTKNIRKTMGVSLTFGLSVGIFFCLLAVTFPKEIMGLFIDDQVVIDLGVKYLRIVAWSYITLSISMSFQVASRGIGKTLLPMIVSAIALSTNTILNYGLIFGNFGMPELGVEGAAIATLIARILEFILLVSLIYGSKSVLAASFKDLIAYNGTFIRQIFKKAGPVLMNEVFWSLGTIVYLWSIGHIDAEAVASYQITLSAYRFYEVVFIGFASAAGIMIGNSIGANKEEDAIYVSRQIVKISLPMSIIISFVMYLCSPLILGLFNVSPVVLNAAQKLFYLYCIYGVSRVFNLMMIVGILRGGGDTRVAMLLEMSSVWLIGVPLSIIGAIVLKLSVVYVVWLILTEEVVKSIFCMYRLKSNKWLHNVIHEIK